MKTATQGSRSPSSLHHEPNDDYTLPYLHSHLPKFPQIYCPPHFTEPSPTEQGQELIPVTDEYSRFVKERKEIQYSTVECSAVCKHMVHFYSLSGSGSPRGQDK